MSELECPRYNAEAAEALNNNFNINLVKGLPEVTSLESLIRALREAFSSDNVNVEHVQALMASYKTNPSEWRQFAKFDEYRYTRNLVDEGNGRYNLMLLCWGEGHGSAIHDHADAHCFMKVLQGSLQEVRYDWPSEDASEEDPLTETGRKTLKTNGVVYMSDALGLHRVENPSHTEGAVSLHLYCPPFSSCSMFDQRTGHRTRCTVTFWSKYGEKVNYKTETPAVTPPENN